MRTVAIANPKSYCGKTTTAVNLAAALARKGMSVLIVDLDPQAHATFELSHDPEILNKTVYHCLVNKQILISNVAINTYIEGLKLAPSNTLLTNAEFELAAAPHKEFILADQLERVKHEYEICFIDCPPSLGLLTLNALVASTDVIAPVQPNYYALENSLASLKKLLDTVELIRKHFSDCRIQTLGLLLNFVENATSPTQEVERQIKQYFGDFAFQTVIHRSIDLAEAMSAGQSILTYAPESAGAVDYRALAEELCDPKSQKKHRLYKKRSAPSLPVTARPKKFRPAAALVSLVKISHRVFHLRTMKRKVGLFLGLAILVAITVSMITATIVNHQPVADQIRVTTQVGTSLPITLTATDLDGNKLTYTVIEGPSHGKLTGEPPCLTYEPAPNYNGPDSFAYMVNDGIINSTPARVSITVIPVNKPLVAERNNATAQQDKSVTVDVLQKSSDADKHPPTNNRPVITSIQPQIATLPIVDGYDEKNQRMLSAKNETWAVQSRDGKCWETDSGLCTVYDFSDMFIPADAVIASVSIYVQHFEQEQFPSGKLQWSIGTGWPANPVVWASIDAPVRQGEQNKAIEGWNVTSSVNTVEKVNSLQLRVKNNDVIGKKKTLVDYIYAEVTWR